MWQRQLLWIDGAAGLSAGLLFLSWRQELSALYQLPPALLTFGASANLLYASFALSLAMWRSRSMVWVKTLICANAVWSALCAFGAAWCLRHASIWSVAHLLAECGFVGSLSAYEWRYRQALALSSRSI